MIIAGLSLIGDTVFVLTRSSLNLGVAMPAIIGLPLLLIGLFRPLFGRLCDRSKLVRVGALLLSLAYLLFILLFSVTSILILANSTAPEDGADALIVLGSGIRGRTPTLTLKYRLRAAESYAARNPDTLIIVSGGQGPDEIVSEAAVMRDYLVSRGMAPERIMLEDRSLSTEENFRFSKELIDGTLGEDAVIVFTTTRVHVFRAERVAAKQGIEAEGIPAKGVWYITFNDYLRECAAITAYFLTGKI